MRMWSFRDALRVGGERRVARGSVQRARRRWPEKSWCGQAIVRSVMNPPESRHEVSVERSSHRCKHLMIGIKWDEWSVSEMNGQVTWTNGRGHLPFRRRRRSESEALGKSSAGNPVTTATQSAKPARDSMLGSKQEPPRPAPSFAHLLLERADNEFRRWRRRPSTAGNPRRFLRSTKQGPGWLCQLPARSVNSL